MHVDVIDPALLQFDRVIRPQPGVKQRSDATLRRFLLPEKYPRHQIRDSFPLPQQQRECVQEGKHLKWLQRENLTRACIIRGARILARLSGTSRDNLNSPSP